MVTTITVATLGLAIGILLGLLGGGGAILAVPALVYVVGMPIHQAVPLSLIVVALASATGAISRVRARAVNWRLAGIFAATGVPAALLGGWLGRAIPEDLLLAGFATIMILAAYRMLHSPDHTGTACAVTDEGGGPPHINWKRCSSRSIPAGLGVGVLTGMFGVGGGFLIVPALVLLLGLPMATAVGTSLLIIIANSLAGLGSHLGSVELDWRVTAVFAATAVVGSLAAQRFAKRISAHQLQKWFAYLVLVLAAVILGDVIIGLFR
ncbi:sulfite exporter TauE/SafE family protein [Hoyosella sp. G463]|uniref:Probable membrane transporter protein n=1 Tax=Lolliginicoccus lacisalsi TaxID=2742202 RepID=A0A927PLH9_9ACTN|nr:sulfite exporter TauE/SafE family protein [Lolliginicoccus lacisalsi]MBD8505849.1 sulfite exporter TauE/SafE family protein [Lolliginicoccus lacisalsi]